MFDEINLTEIGRVVKSHGVKGSVKVKFNKHFDFEKFQIEEPVFIILNELPVPFFIESYDFGGGHHIIKFSFIDNLDKAEHIRGATISIINEASESNHFKNDSTRIVDYKVYSKEHGYIGEVSGINEIPGNPVLEILNNNTTILVPFVKEFIVAIDHSQKKMEINPPKGLIELYL